MAQALEIAEQTQVIDACWERLRTLVLVDQQWPRPDAIPAREALLRWAPEIHERLQTKHALIHRFGVIPIVAVVGLLNSGKSSLTASFLSAANRKRVLRGVSQRQGSQRFTLWVPHSWKEDTLFFEKLCQMLTRVFATEPELLADDEAEAQAQQNAVENLHRPLIGVDASLTEHHLGILDCPDIQRAQQIDDRSRLELVERAAEICAAVFVVFARSQVEIRTLQDILDAMPGARRIHAINLIKDDPAERVRAEAASVLNLDANDPVYGAYDFLSAHYQNRTPAWDPNLSRTPEERMAMSEPCFFKIHPDPAANSPKSIGEDRSMKALADELTPHAVKSRRMQELIREFYQDLQSGIDAVQERLDSSWAGLNEASRRLRDHCQDLLTEGGHLQIKMSPDIVQSMEQSLARTANVYYKWLLLPQRKFLQACTKLVEKGRDIALPGKALREKKDALESKWRASGSHKVKKGSVKPEDVQRMLSLWSSAIGHYREAADWKEESERVLQRFIDEDKTNLTDAEWDALTGPLWKQMPKKARLQLITSAFLMFGGVLLAFFDGGVSLVSLKAMDLLGGIGVVASLGVNMQGAKDFEKALEEKLGLQQVANFHAVVCDIVGLPRDREDRGHLPDPTVPVKLNQDAFGIRARGWTRHQVNAEALKEIRAYGL